MSVTVPAEALKRFAEELKLDQVGGGRFLRDNMGRVDQFILKPNVVELPKLTGKELAAYQEKERVLKGKEEASRRIARTKGLYAYPKDEVKSGMSELQTRPEFSTALGPRSRFGEGDGGYFDRWLNTDERISSFRRPTDEGVKMGGDVHPPFSGFKHHVSHMENPRKLEYVAVKPYAQRRKERLLREGGATLSAAEREEIENDTNVGGQVDTAGRFIQDGTGLVSPQAPPQVPEQDFDNEDDAEPVDAVRKTAAAPYLTLPELRQEDAEIYFGPKARAAFFDFYKQMSAMRAMSVSGNTLDLMARGTADTDEEDEGQQQQLTAAERRHGVEKNKNKEGKGRGSVMDDGTAELQEFQKAYEPDGGEKPPDTAALEKTHFTLPLIKKDDGVSEVIPGFFRPASARSRFISACVENNVGPRPALVMRSGVTSTLSLRGQYMGDAVAQNLAIALEVMPYLQNLDLASNSLTDMGLCTIMRSLPVCSSLAGVDFSDNNIGVDGMDALGELLLNEECNIAKLVLKQCNLTDSALKDFLYVIGVKSNLRHLDLSRNNIGRPENLAIHGDESPGVLALAALVAHPSCVIEVLNISWNAVGRSFPVLADAIEASASLTSLDLSYNSLGDHGEALGAALSRNRTLTSLDVSYNKLKARSSCTVVSAIYACKTLQRIDLSGNPVGKLGAAAIMKLRSRLGKHVHVNMDGCSVSVRDSSTAIAIDTRNPIGNYTLNLAVPYERVLCLELARVVAENERLTFKSFSLDGEESLQFERISAQVEARTRIVESAVEGEGEDVEEKEVVTESENKLEEIDVDAAADEFLRGGKSTMNILELTELFLRTNIVGDITSREQECKKYANDILRLYDVDRSGDIDVAEFCSYLHDLRLRREVEQANIVLRGADTFSYLVLAGGGGKKTSPSPPPFTIPDEGTASITVAASFEQPHHKKVSSKEEIMSLVSCVRTSSESSEMLKIAVEGMCLQYEDACVLFRILTKEDGDKVNALTTLLPVVNNPISARTLIAHAGLNSLKEVSQLKNNLGPMMYRVCVGAFNGYYFMDLAREEDRLCLVRLLEASAFAHRFRNDSKLGDTSERRDWSCFRNVMLNGEEFDMNSEENVELGWGDVLPVEGIIHFDFSYSVDEASGNPDNAAIVSSDKLYNLLHSLGCIGLDMVTKEAFLESVRLLEELGQVHAADATNAEAANERYSTMRALLSTENLKRRASKARVKAENALHSLSTEELGMASAGMRLEQKRRMEDERKTRHNTADDSSAAANKVPQAPMQSELLNSLCRHVEHMESYASEHPQDSRVDLLLAMRRADVLQHSLCCRMLTCAQVSLILKTFPCGFLSPRAPDDAAASTRASMATLSLDDGTGSCAGSLPAKEYSTLRVDILVDAFHQIVDRWHFGLVLATLTSVEVGMVLTRLGLLNVFTSVAPPAALRLDLSKQDQKQYLRVLMVINGVEKSWDEDVVYATVDEAAAEAAADAAKEVAEAQKAAAAATPRDDAEATDVVSAPVSPKKNKKGKKDADELELAAADISAEGASAANADAVPAGPPPSEWASEAALPGDGVVTLLLSPPVDVNISKSVREVLMGCCLSANRHGSGAKKPSLDGAEKIAQLEHMEISFVHEKRQELLE